MSDLSTTFTFRLSGADKATLEHLATRLGCDRGAALRLLIRRAGPSLGREGCFVTPKSPAFRVKLLAKGGDV